MFEQTARTAGSNWKLWMVLAVLFLGLAALILWIVRMTSMPSRSYAGELAPLSAEQAELSAHLSQHVKYLSETIGERNLWKAGTLEAGAGYIRSNLQEAGYSVREQSYSVAGHAASNLEAKVEGSDGGKNTVIIGAHYDSVRGSPGANDNATGVAAVLELARLLRDSKPRTALRFVLFVNEEPPFFQTDSMGSLVYARQLRRDEIAVSAMFSLETIGFYSDAPGSQKYPPPLGLFYPSRGNFIGFVGNPSSRALLSRAIRRFRETTRFPSEGVAAPGEWLGIGWSDHWSFWQQEYPAIMITDTAPFRYPYYHSPFDTDEHVDFARMARVVDGIRRVIESVATED
jgi:Zn-dependent M28 family amino/carboxypeptidase